MVTVRAGPTVSTLDKRRNYDIHICCGIERESVLARDEITVQNDEIWPFLRKDLTHQRGGIDICYDAKTAFIFTVMEIREGGDVEGAVLRKLQVRLAEQHRGKHEQGGEQGEHGEDGYEGK